MFINIIIDQITYWLVKYNSPKVSQDSLTKFTLDGVRELFSEFLSTEDFYTIRSYVSMVSSIFRILRDTIDSLIKFFKLAEILPTLQTLLRIAKAVLYFGSAGIHVLKIMFAFNQQTVTYYDEWQLGLEYVITTLGTVVSIMEDLAKLLINSLKGLLEIKPNDIIKKALKEGELFLRKYPYPILDGVEDM